MLDPDVIVDNKGGSLAALVERTERAYKEEGGRGLVVGINSDSDTATRRHGMVQYHMINAESVGAGGQQYVDL